MTTLENALLAALTVSAFINLWAAQTLQAARHKLFHARFMTAVWENAFKDLRANSHRRDPKTGRLLRKGE